ncbi:MAG: SDR family oxidoreductase [SAR202 cluster bacterium]|nr:SDR family oxidoreductase [SAR202 cluster bacterium]
MISSELMEHKRLKDKVAIITGGATGVLGKVMGIGGASAWAFVEQGAKVLIADVDHENGHLTASQINSTTNTKNTALFMKADVKIESDWEKLISYTESKFGRIDILVHAAGKALTGDIDKTDLCQWDEMMDIHSKGVFLGTKCVIPVMRRSKHGSIVIVSSIDSHVGGSGTAYSAAKGSGRTFAKVSAIQLAKDNIRVNSVHPGYTDTPLSRKLVAEITADGSPDPRVPRIPLGRVANSHEIAKLILFLASDESSYITGAEVIIDGGVTSQ